MQSTSRHLNTPDWVSIGKASEFLGVNPGTLRQWTSLGKLHVFRTPGGHRRFSSAELAALSEPAAAPAAGIEQTLLSQLRSRYRSMAHSASHHEQWITDLDPAARERFHTLGDTLLDQLGAYLATTNPRERRAALQTGRDLGRRYGEGCTSAGLDTARAIEAYVLFRRPLLDVLTKTVSSHPDQSPQTSRIVRDAERFMDEVLACIASGAGSRSTVQHSA